MRSDMRSSATWTGAWLVVAMASSVGCTVTVDLDRLQGGEAAPTPSSSSSSGSGLDFRPDPNPLPAPLPDEDVQDDACASSVLLGNWLAVDIKVGQTLSFAADCSGWDGVCGAAFSYEPVVEQAGLVAIEVLSSQDPSCITPGTYACSYSLLPDTLLYDCGQGEQMYTRVP